jgi:hypothetical protein
MDNEIYEVLYELAEDENDELRQKIKILQAYIRELEADNKSLSTTFINLIRLDKRLN